MRDLHIQRESKRRQNTGQKSAPFPIDQSRLSQLQKNILSKIHIHRSRNHAVIPCINPVAPIEWSSPLHIIDHATKKSDFPPFGYMLTPLARIRGLPVQTRMVPRVGAAEEVEAVFPGLACVGGGVLKRCRERVRIGSGAGCHCGIRWLEDQVVHGG